MTMHRENEDLLTNIPSLSLSQDEVADYHAAHVERASTVRDTNSNHFTMGMPKLLWGVIICLVLVVIGGGYWSAHIILGIQEKFTQNEDQLQQARDQLNALGGEVASTGKKVSTTGNALKDQVQSLNSQVHKLQEQFTKYQKDNKTQLDKQAQTIASIDKKATDAVSKSGDNKAAQDAAKKLQADMATMKQQTAKINAQMQSLETKINEMSLDMTAQQERGAGATASGDSQQLAQITQQLQSIDTYRQSTNASINKIQTDINNLYTDVESLKSSR